MIHTVKENRFKWSQNRKRRAVSRDFPAGPVIMNPPCNLEDADSISGWGTKIPYAKGTTKLMGHNYWVHAQQLETVHAATPRATTKTQYSQINT